VKKYLDQQYYIAVKQFYLFMSIAVKHNHTPIKAILTALSDFSPELDSYSILLEKKLENIEINEKSSDSEDEFILFPGRLIQLKN